MSDLIKINGRELKSFGFSTTGASFLLGLGHVYHSAERKGDMYNIEASPEDHKRIIDHAECLEIWVTDSSKAVGAALAALKFDEINEESIRDLGYLISGLGDLQKLIKNTRDVIEESKESLHD